MYIIKKIFFFILTETTWHTTSDCVNKIAGYNSYFFVYQNDGLLLFVKNTRVWIDE